MPTRHDKPSLHGRFLTFEGIDGCGKTTQADRLVERIRARGLTVLQTREPGGTTIGEALRAVLLDGRHSAMTPRCELLLYLADRAQHVGEVIAPALARGELVVCDRFHDATVAYQQHGRGLDLGSLEAFIEREVLLVRPHLTFWLDVDVAEARRRIAQRNHARGSATGAGCTGDESRLDSAESAFHQRVRAGYEAIWQAEPERVVRIDAARGVEAVAGDIWARLEERYGL